MEKGTCTMICNDKVGGFTSDTYSHATITASTSDLEKIDFKIDFVPISIDNTIRMTRKYDLCIRTNASYLVEHHKDSDSLYIHGMRRLVSHVGWAMARAPTCNMRLPLMPPGES